MKDLDFGDGTLRVLALDFSFNLAIDHSQNLTLFTSTRVILHLQIFHH